MGLFSVDTLFDLGESVIDFFSSDTSKNNKKTKQNASSHSSRNNAKTYTSNKKRNFDRELNVFKNIERKRLMDRHKVCHRLFYPSKFRASYIFSEHNHEIEKLDLEIKYIDTLFTEIKKMEQKYVEQKQS